MASPFLPRRWAVWAVVGVLALAGGAAAWRWRQHSPPAVVAGDENTDDDLDEPVARNPGYLGPQACADCHAARVAAFRATNHFRACREPQAGDMPPGFAPGRGICPTHDPDLRFEMSQAGDDYFLTAVRRTPAGEHRAPPSRIALRYGTGNGDEVYFTWRDDRLFELPVAWLHPLRQWGVVSYMPSGGGDFSRETTTRCLECHTTWFAHRAGTRNEYQRDSLILGISCERCHGPGQDHRAYHLAHPDADTAHAIVHPGRLPRDRQLDVCGQCHSNTFKPRAPPFSYRPGKPLEAYFRVIPSKYPEEDHVANQVKYLRQSKCFQKSDTLTCTTCHDPHKSRDLADPASGRRACLTCHRPEHCAEQARLPGPVRGDCIGCHMPQRYRMVVSFHTADDEYVPVLRPHEHRIGIYPEARQEVLWAWHRAQADAASRQETARLTQALAGHWLTECENCRRAHRFLAAVGAAREALRFDSSPATRTSLKEALADQGRLDAGMAEATLHLEQQRYAQAIAALQRVLDFMPDLALAHDKLGMCYALAGRREEAVPEFQTALRQDPEDTNAYTMLGWFAYLEGRPEEAADAYLHAEAVEPFNAKISYHLGLALAQLGRLPEATDRFRRALAIDPRHAGACQGLSDVLRRQGQADEAVRFARRAARLTRDDNADVLLTLAEAYAAAGRLVEADAAAARALAAAEASSPQLVPQIQARREELRQRRAGR